MENFNLRIDKTPHKTKPDTKEIRNITTRLKKAKSEPIKLQDLAELIKRGATFLPCEFKDDAGEDIKEKNINYSWLLGIDVDNMINKKNPFNPNDQLPSYKFIELFKEMFGATPAIEYRTFGHKPGVVFKFRLIYRLERPLTKTEYKKFYGYLINSFIRDTKTGLSYLDKSTSNLNRLWFGTCNDVVYYDDNIAISSQKIDEILELTGNKKAAKKKTVIPNEIKIEPSEKISCDRHNSIISHLGELIRTNKQYRDFESLYQYALNFNESNIAPPIDEYGEDKDEIKNICTWIIDNFIPPEKQATEIKADQTDELRFYTTTDYKKLGLARKKGFLVEGLIVEKSLGFIIAPPKLGKTNFAYCLALAMARGENFIGHKCNKKCKVLYLLLEGSFGELLDNYGDDQNIIIIDETQTPDFTWQKRRKAIVKKILQEKIDIVFIDSLFVSTNNDVEKAKELQPYLNDLLKVSSDLGVTFLALHHTNRMQNVEDEQSKVAGSAVITRMGEFFIYLSKYQKTEDEEIAETKMSDEELNKKPLKFVMKKKDYRYGKIGFPQYLVTINTAHKYINFERYKLEVKRADPSNRAADLKAYAEHLLKQFKVINKKQFSEVLAEEYGILSATTIYQKYIDDIFKYFVDKEFIEPGKKYDYTVLLQPDGILEN